MAPLGPTCHESLLTNVLEYSILHVAFYALRRSWLCELLNQRRCSWYWQQHRTPAPHTSGKFINYLSRRPTCRSIRANICSLYVGAHWCTCPFRSQYVLLHTKAASSWKAASADYSVLSLHLVQVVACTLHPPRNGCLEGAHGGRGYLCIYRQNSGL